MNRNITVTELDAETAAKDFHEYAIAVKSRYETNHRMIGHYDLELTDLNHMIEFSNFNASEGYKLVSKVRENRRKRRTCKNENSVLKPLYDFLTNSNGNMLNALAKVVKDSDAALGSVVNQQYYPRTELFTKEELNGKVG